MKGVALQKFNFIFYFWRWWFWVGQVITHIIHELSTGRHFASGKATWKPMFYLTKTARNYRCSLCCDLCLAVKSPNNRVMNIGNLTMDAAWKHTISFVDPSDPSPWMNVPGFTDKKMQTAGHFYISCTWGHSETSFPLASLTPWMMARWPNFMGCKVNVKI